MVGVKWWLCGEMTRGSKRELEKEELPFLWTDFVVDKGLATRSVMKAVLSFFRDISINFDLKYYYCLVDAVNRITVQRSMENYRVTYTTRVANSTHDVRRPE